MNEVALFLSKGQRNHGLYAYKLVTIVWNYAVFLLSAASNSFIAASRSLTN